MAKRASGYLLGWGYWCRSSFPSAVLPDLGHFGGVWHDKPSVFCKGQRVSIVDSSRFEPHIRPRHLLAGIGASKDVSKSIAFSKFGK